MESSKVEDKVPVKSNLKIKEQDKGHMVFNLETSGFHLLQKDAINVLEKVDGNKSVKEIAKTISENSNEGFDSILNQLIDFFTELEKRKLIRWKS